jgi:hypothetical protein
MEKPEQHGGWSRRACLGSAAAGVAAIALKSGASRAAERTAPEGPGPTVRDRMWIFTVAAGGDNDSLEKGNVRGGSRMTPAEGAFYLNVPNLLLIRSRDVPRLPTSSDQAGRAQTEFEQYALSFRPLDRVVWSVVGSGGKGGLDELPHVLDLAKRFPNVCGIYLDDFVVESKRQPDGRVAGRPALAPAELKAAREGIAKTLGRPLEVWVTLYTHEINPARKTARPGFRGCEPPLAGFLDLFDVLTLWTWNSEELGELEGNLAALERIAPAKARIALGMYLWDFHHARPVPVERMRHQCERGLKWLQEGRVSDLIFLANTVLDVGLESAEFSRQWIAQVGGQPLARKRP